MSQPSEKKRKIESIVFELLPDSIADKIIQQTRYVNRTNRNVSSAVRTFPFHVDSEAKYDVVIHNFLGQKHQLFATEMFIAGSHLHPKFFNYISNLFQHANMTYDMAILNDIVNHVKTGKKFSETASFRIRESLAQIKDVLTDAELQALPDRFHAFLLPVDKAFVALMHGKVVRRYCSSVESETVRYKYIYSCSEQGKVEKHETQEKDSFWPHSIQNNSSGFVTEMMLQALNKYGVVCVPLSNEFVLSHTRNVAAYLAEVMKIPDDSQLLSVEFMKRKRLNHPEWMFVNKDKISTKHIQDFTGKTAYGHECKALRDLWDTIEFFIITTLPEPLTVTTSRIRIQC